MMEDKNNSPLVSICVPVYGVEKYVGKCFETLFSQTYKNIEYVVVNDCTPDNSINIIKETVKHYPERICQLHIINHEHNRGLAAARNTAVANAKGEFILHIDSDDFVEPTIVEKLVDKQKETNADIVSCDTFYVFPKHRKIFREKEVEPYINGVIDIITGIAAAHIWSRLYRRAIYIENNIEASEGANMGEDYQVVPRLFYYSRIVAYVHLPLYYYNCINDNSYSNNMSLSRMSQSKKSHDVIFNFFMKENKAFDIPLRIMNLNYAVSYFKYYLCNKKASYCYKMGLEYVTKDNLKALPYMSFYKKIILRIAYHKTWLTLIMGSMLKLNTLLKRIHGNN